MKCALIAAVLLQATESPSLSNTTSVTIRAGTPVQLTTETSLDSRSVRQGQRFTVIVAEDVTDGAHVLIAKGTRAVGEVEAVSGKGMFGKAGSLLLRPLFVEVAQQRINLEGAEEARGKEQLGGAAVATVLTGGFGLFITGKSATVPAGSILRARVRSDATISAAR